MDRLGLTMKRPIIICGLHRSYTSVLTQCMINAGVKMSSDNNLGTIHNEDLSLLELNQNFMNDVGIPVYDIISSFEIDQSSVNDKFISDLRNYRKLREKESKGDHWGFKAPRIASLMYQYAEVFPDATYICCVRNPIKCSRSWKLRGNIKDEFLGVKYFAKQLTNVIECSERKNLNMHLFNCDGNLDVETERLKVIDGLTTINLKGIRQ